MSKRILAVLLGVGLVAGALVSAGPAKAQDAATEIPETVQIDDPAGDANFLNDQDNAYGSPAEGEGDHAGPAGGTATDLLKIWFTNTAETVSLNFQTVAAPGNLAYDVYYRFGTNPGTGDAGADETRGCVFFVTWVNGSGGGYTGDDVATVQDKCNVGGDPVAGTLAIGEGPEGTGITTMTFPRSYSPLFVDGSKLTAPFGVVRVVNVGPTPTTATAGTIDTTQRGTDYEIVGDVVEKPEKPKKPKPGKSNPPGKGKKKGCDKGKGKKKGACPQPKPLSCEAFAPGEAGKEQPLVTLTDAATEEAPVEQAVTLAESVGDLVPVSPPGEAYFNIQVDSAKPDAGLYVLLEFPERRDYDLNLLHPDGSYAARSRGFNTVIGTPAEGEISDPGYGGEPTTSSEKLVGIKTSDCGGWTLQVQNWLGEGGDFNVKLWLGDPANDPQAEGEEPPA